MYPRGIGFLAIAKMASKYFARAFATQPRTSPVADFLATSSRRGWEVKRKLVWLGTRSFLFRFAFTTCMQGQEIAPGEGIAATDDFLCQQCTEWSGAQQTFRGLEDFASIRRQFREKSPNIVYRYCPDLEQKARKAVAAHFANFVRFHGSDFAVFPDGLSAAAAEQKRMRTYSEAKVGEDLPRILKKYGIKRLGQASYPSYLLDSQRGVAVFYREGEGVEMVANYDELLSALKKKDQPLTQAEMEMIQGVMEDNGISPTFVRRVINDTGSSEIEKLYFLPEGTNGVEYLLRRFKGHYFRERYPCISLLE